MDVLDSEGPVIWQTLKELRTINKWLGGNNVTLNGISSLIKKSGPRESPYKIMDLGCGGGDMLRLVADWFRKKSIPVILVGVDANPSIISYAEENSTDYPEISYEQGDVFNLDFRSKDCDIYLCTLFTHHFDEPALEGLLQNLYEHANLGVVINDLHRHWFAYYSIKFITRFFSKSPMVQNDAPLSVLRAFRKDDLLNIIKTLPEPVFTLKWRWAFRWELVIFSNE